MTCLYLSTESQYLWESFHYDPAQKKYAELKKGLVEYQFLLSITSAAVQHLKKGDLEQFDALVGENACQIRAIRIAISAKLILSSRLDDIFNRVNTITKKIEELSQLSSINFLMQEGVSLLEVIERHSLDVLLTPDELFIIQSYLLCEARLFLPEGEFLSSLFRIEKCSAKLMQNKYPYLSYSFIGKLTDSLRIRLSQTSADFVRKIASELADPLLVRMVSSEFEIIHNGLTCIPAFWSFKTLFTFAIKVRLPLVFHAKFLSEGGGGYQVIDEDLLYFKTCDTSGVYMTCDFTKLDPLTPVCVIEGALRPLQRKGITLLKKRWRKSIEKRSPIEVLLAAAADHRQYPDPTRGVPIKNEEYDCFKHIASKDGFALLNPTTFFVRHIYSTCLSNIIKKVDSSVEGKLLLV
jgi:hypothetical protein